MSGVLRLGKPVDEALGILPVHEAEGHTRKRGYYQS